MRVNRGALNQWVVEQMNSRKMSMRELGKQAGMQHSYISRILSDKQEAALDFYIRVAAVFGAVPEMLAVGEVIGPGELDDISLLEIFKAVKALNPQERQELERYLDYLAHKRDIEAKP